MDVGEIRVGATMREGNDARSRTAAARAQRASMNCPACGARIVGRPPRGTNKYLVHESYPHRLTRAERIEVQRELERSYARRLARRRKETT